MVKLRRFTNDGVGRLLDATTLSGGASGWWWAQEDCDCGSVTGWDHYVPEDSQYVMSSGCCGKHLMEEVGSIVGSFLLLSFSDRYCF